MKQTRKDNSASAVFKSEDIMPWVARVTFGSSYRADIAVGRL